MSLFAAATLAVLATAPVDTRTERAASEPHWRVELETSPQFPLLAGFAVGVGVKAPQHVRLGFNAFTLQIPELFFAQSNQGQGWSVRHFGIGLTAQFYLRADSEGFFAGAMVAPHRNVYAVDGDQIAVTELFVGGQVGYQWFPSESLGLYVMPWLAVTVPVYEGSELVVGERRFESKPVTVFPAIFVGWRL
jgi:hypothetical protein